jgi:ribosome-associated toxin RatA of RatAB toxin-antitoxin module
MPEITKTVLVEHSPEQMFELVDAVERYPEFLPWCGGANVSHRDDVTTRATLHINYRGIRQSFTTENAKSPPQEMTVKLVEGPFRSLDGAWRFLPLRGGGCKIEFRLRYEFSSRILERLVGPVFNYIANTMVDAFVRRAEALYGTRQ